MKLPDLILERFPMHSVEISRRFFAEPRFREVCEDFETAEQALRHWQAHDDADGKRIQDYTLLRDELSSEMLTLLGRHSAASGTPQGSALSTHGESTSSVAVRRAPPSTVKKRTHT